MGADDSFLDCCQRPSTKTVKVLLDKNHDSELIQRCACGQHYFKRWSEVIRFDDGPDDWTVWITRITDDEAVALTRADRPHDLAFLEGRPALCIDDRGCFRVGGAPSGPWQ